MIIFPDSLSRVGRILPGVAFILIILIAVKMTSYIVTLFSDVLISHISPCPGHVMTVRIEIDKYPCHDCSLCNCRTGYSFCRGYGISFLPNPDF